MTPGPVTTDQPPRRRHRPTSPAHGPATADQTGTGDDQPCTPARGTCGRPAGRSGDVLTTPHWPSSRPHAPVPTRPGRGLPLLTPADVISCHFLLRFVLPRRWPCDGPSVLPVLRLPIGWSWPCSLCSPGWWRPGDGQRRRPRGAVRAAPARSWWPPRPSNRGRSSTAADLALRQLPASAVPAERHRRRSTTPPAGPSSPPSSPTSRWWPPSSLPTAGGASPPSSRPAAGRWRCRTVRPSLALVRGDRVDVLATFDPPPAGEDSPTFPVAVGPLAGPRRARGGGGRRRPPGGGAGGLRRRRRRGDAGAHAEVRPTGPARPVPPVPGTPRTAGTSSSAPASGQTTRPTSPVTVEATMPHTKRGCRAGAGRPSPGRGPCRGRRRR